MSDMANQVMRLRVKSKLNLAASAISLAHASASAADRTLGMHDGQIVLECGPVCTSTRVVADGIQSQQSRQQVGVNFQVSPTETVRQGSRPSMSSAVGRHVDQVQFVPVQRSQWGEEDDVVGLSRPIHATIRRSLAQASAAPPLRET